MTHVFVCAHPGGEPTYHDTESGAEHAAHELIASKRATYATCYRMTIHEENQ